ncbi:hypothetical protein DFH08DRAFT_822227 [Mycena albidolilacea]|uniref:Uncharacterized protein n=1 Tax=Mycena albidolilacea TaxID=1033008 RepID=A0AAD7ECH3_9AGAR|nr:hypothetical protein DFH08DRAFT_822227 [Mycena albidolilacea]
MGLKTEYEQMKTKGVRTYGEIAQPRSHFVKERLIEAEFDGEKSNKACDRLRPDFAKRQGDFIALRQRLPAPAVSPVVLLCSAPCFHLLIMPPVMSRLDGHRRAAVKASEILQKARVQVAWLPNCSHPRQTPHRIRPAQRRDGSDWQIDMAEALPLGLDCSLIVSLLRHPRYGNLLDTWITNLLKVQATARSAAAVAPSFGGEYFLSRSDQFSNQRNVLFDFKFSRRRDRIEGEKAKSTLSENTLGAHRFLSTNERDAGSKPPHSIATSFGARINWPAPLAKALQSPPDPISLARVDYQPVQ